MTRSDKLHRTSRGAHLRASVAAVAAVLTLAGGFVGLSPAEASMLQGPAIRAAESMQLRGALLHGEHEKLRRFARQHDDSASLLARAYLAELDGDLEQAERFVEAAVQQGGGKPARRAAALAEARLLRARGKWTAAEEKLREALGAFSGAHYIRVELGELLIDTGRKAEAEPLLDQLSQKFNSGQLDSASGLYALGEAMALLDSFQDANHAFELAYEKDSQYVPGIVEWGELFLSKYNTADAERTFDDALNVDDGHPGALVGKARVIMETQNYYAEARKNLRRARERYASSPELLLTRAELAIYDGKWDLALQFTDKVLDQRPKHLEAQAVQAAVHYLRDDPAAFERVKNRALELNPSFAEIYTRTAEFAVLVHRYKEGVELNRKALEIQKKQPEALLGLGIGLSRLGHIDRAKKTLEKAFDADPYNVRAYNMLQFFENTMPKYDVFRHDRFLLRAHQSESKVVDRLVSPLVEEALATYRDKYGFEPASELSVEIYRKPESFGVRTVGLPHISPHGICFGPVVATRSPSEGNFNWRQVVWHEIAHVFHIQESGYRVPRWFTEGLAEYETNVKEPAWVRHHERRIASALREDSIPTITNLDRRFTQARSYEDILKAYHLSSLAIHFIVDTWSFDAVNRMIEGFQKRVQTQDVIERVLDVSVQEFDAKFRAWLQDRLVGFDRQLLISLKDIQSPKKLEKSTPPSGRNGWYRARRAVGLLRQGKSEDSVAAMEEALEIGSSDPRVQYAATAFYATRGRSKRAYKHGLKVLDAGRDDYLHRVRLGRLARILEDLEAARVHLTAAVQLYPDGFGAWRELLKIAESTEDAALEHRAVRRMFELDQTSALAARRYTKLAMENRRWKRAWEGVERWYAVEPFNPKMQRARARVARATEQPGAALEAWKVLAALRPASAGDVWLDAVEALSQMDGAGDELETAIQRARRAGVPADALEDARVN